MKKFFRFLQLLTSIAILSSAHAQDKFPNGAAISKWFETIKSTNIETLGKQFLITDFGGTKDSTIVQTAKIQQAIDQAYASGGGVVVVPKGIYLSGSLFFKPKTHLYLEEGAVLK